MARFEVHSHTQFSNLRMLDSTNHEKRLVKRAFDLGLSGIAITDHEALNGAVRFNKLAKEYKDTGFKVAIGNEIYLVENRDAGQKYFHFILIAKDEIGFTLMKELSTNAWLNSYNDRALRVPTLKSELKSLINKYGKGHLIATSACLGGELSTLTLALCNAERVQDNQTAQMCYDRIISFITEMKEIFGDDFYIECAPGRSDEQIVVNNRLLPIADYFNVKMVIGCDAHYLSKEDKYVHSAFLNSREEDRETESFYAYAYLQDEDDIKSNLKGTVLEEEYLHMVKNSEEIYEKIEFFDISKNQRIPEVEIKDYGKQLIFLNQPTLCQLFRSDDIRERYWVNECINALHKMNLNGSEEWELYMNRLEIEADIIKYIGKQKNVCLFQYFNTLQHYIDLFWECGSIVGPGRGSSTGFLSNYLMGITQLDPIRWQLQYWRFLNKERVEYPDIDLDLAPSKRPLIFEKIRAERGELGLAQVCTFKKEGTKSAILTGCRGYRNEDYPDGIDSDEARYMSSLIPAERGFLWEIEDVINGNEEKGRKPVTAFINEVNKYPGLLDIIQGIEGLISGRGEHASGVILYNDNPYETACFMRAPNGDITTQFDLHDAEDAGDIKYDFLVTETSDKLIKCLDLLTEYKQIKPNSLREQYNLYLHPEYLDTNNPALWKALAAGSVLDVFQFNSGVGLAIAKKIKPQNPIEMTAANALMRLMSEKGKESQQDRFARIKKEGLGSFEFEMQRVGLNEKQRTVMHKYCDEYYGCVPTQELMMQILMDTDIAGFTLGEANEARKIVAKKKMNEIPKLKQKFTEHIRDEVFRNYVWEIAVQPSLGYAFSINHSLPYSFVGLQTIELATKFNPIFWNTACLIVNTGSLNEDENDSTDYAKLAKALGDIQSAGIRFSLADINKSKFGFIPDLENNSILFGLKAVDKIGTDVVNEILENRTYTNFSDFLSKTNLKKPAIISLIKGGAFDSMDDRKMIMGLYIWMTCDKKKRITLQNFNGLIQRNLLPNEFDFQKKVFEFNRYLKACCKLNTEYYRLDERAENFYINSFGYDNLEYSQDLNAQIIKQKTWEKIYNTEMDCVRDWMKANQTEILKTLNYSIFKDDWDKYASGTISHWEMESLCFYYHEHELAHLKNEKYGIEDFFSLSEEPDVEKYYYRDNIPQPIYKIHTIAGTCIAKDKAKSTIYLLTTSGVVTVKFRKEYFALFDKQLSQKQPDGTKKVVEKSWFSRGNMLIIKGIRRGDDFIPKKYSTTEGHQLYKIQEIDKNGDIIITNERALREEE